MPYNPSGTFDPRLGGLGAAQAIAEELKKWQENQKEGAYNDTIVQHAFQQGRIGMEEMNKYQQASGTAKRGIAAGLAASMLDDFKREQAKQEMLARQAGLQLQLGGLNLREREFADEALNRQQRANWRPDPSQFIPIPQSGQVLVPTQPGQYQMSAKPEPAADQYPPIGSPAHDEHGNQVGVYESKGRIKLLRPNDSAGYSADLTKQSIGRLDGQIAKLETELAKGNKRWGPDWAGIGDYASKLAQLRAERAALAGEAAPTAPPATPAVAQNGPPRITTQAQFDALPSGAEFIDPQGNRRRKP